MSPRRTPLLTAAVLLALLAALLTGASAQCIECKSCKGSSNCLKFCKPKCEVAVNAKSCEKFGANVGTKEGKDACAMAVSFCSSTSTPKPQPRFIPVTLKQCENLAYVRCVGSAETSAKSISDCNKGLISGLKACSQSLFTTFWKGEVEEACNKAAATLQA